MQVLVVVSSLSFPHVSLANPKQHENMQKKPDESDCLPPVTYNKRHPGQRESSWELDASDKDQHSQSRRTTEITEPAAASRQSRNSTSSKPASERWTREEYQTLINRALREYAAASSTIVAEPKDLQQQPRGLRGGDENNAGAERATATAVDTDQLDRKPAAARRPHLPAEKRQTAAIPQENDVLFGRSKHQKNHKGNNDLRKLCDEQRSVYDLADRDDKTVITRSLVKKIASIGGRFLKFHIIQKMWLEVSEEEARLKVAHTMRDGRPQPLGRLEPEMFPPLR